MLKVLKALESMVPLITESSLICLQYKSGMGLPRDRDREISKGQTTNNVMRDCYSVWILF